MLVRKANNQDFPEIFSMGFDTWGQEGFTKEQHVEFCYKRIDYKYKYGHWYVLEEHGSLKSSLICYRNAFGLLPGAVGVGSVATLPAFRNQGFMSHLLKQAIFMESQAVDLNYFILFSDIDPYVYQKIGFIILPNELQKCEDSVIMILPVREKFESILSKNFSVPEYF
ncbi:GNAT family N-acetyltransferase [Silvanigrella aquatica]|uniref:N-acetyltransferase domain-containing protein n=1 Tax=Silvanigrella aquatica TaxID=1915309 RepID=A0A1L4CZQ8_9BACT|nr:GNAT family N-acetyltransferase [Silvanigrella aquatica]APJ03417.1 hypothetical protein AXG55_05660 [Silvanigrella aquatica]